MRPSDPKDQQKEHRFRSFEQEPTEGGGWEGSEEHLPPPAPSLEGEPETCSPFPPFPPVNTRKPSPFNRLRINASRHRRAGCYDFVSLCYLLYRTQKPSRKLSRKPSLRSPLRPSVQNSGIHPASLLASYTTPDPASDPAPTPDPDIAMKGDEEERLRG